jgi:RND family efflux transporter MFP subunit
MTLGWSAAGAALLALALAGCGAETKPPAAEAAIPAGERLTLKPVPIADMKPVSGEVTGRDQAEARARIGGTLISLSVRAGDMVKKGQRIGRISDARLGYEAAAAGAQVAAAEAEAARAQAELARIEDLYENSVYAKARLDQAVAAARAASAQAAAARAQQGASASLVGQGDVLAPVAGRVLRAEVPEGSVVSPGQSIASLAAGPVVLRLMLPESLGGGLKLGAPVVLTPPLEGATQGQIVQIYPAITAGQLRVDAKVPGLSERFIGRRVGASIAVGERDGLVVPQRFVKTRYGVDQVEIVSGKTLSAVPVQVAPVAEAGMVEILSGVGAGDTLFVAAAPR